MTKFKIIALITLGVASMAAALMIHQRSEAAIQDRAALLQQQGQQLADLKAEQQHLSDLVARAANPRVEDHAAELAKLRSQAESLRKQTNELVAQSKLRLTPRPLHPPSNSETHSPEYWEQMRQAQESKSTEARDIAVAMTIYAWAHQKQFPSSLDQLPKDSRVLSGTNQFEIVYQGSLDQLDGLPLGSIAIVREIQPRLMPFYGNAARVYGMANGSSQVVTSDDNFQSWEAEHVISPPNSAR